MNNKGNYSLQANRRGFALIETLIAFVVLAVGLLALLSFYNESQKGVASAKAQAEASSLAEEKLQELESYLIVDDPRFTNDSDTVSGILGTYEREWLIEDVSGTKKVTVSVAWDGDQVTEVVSYIRNTSPHQDVANLLKVTANQAGLFDGGGGFDWGDGTGGDGGGDQGGDDDGDGGNDDGGNQGGGGGNEDAEYYITVKGNWSFQTDNKGNPEGTLNGVSISNLSNEANPSWSCSVQGSLYTCNSSAVPSVYDWQGTISYTNSGYLCKPTSEDRSLAAGGGGGDKIITVDVYLTKNFGQCGK